MQCFSEPTQGSKWWDQLVSCILQQNNLQHNFEHNFKDIFLWHVMVIFVLTWLGHSRCVAKYYSGCFCEDMVG